MLKKEMENNLDKICQLIKEHVSDSLWENLGYESAEEMGRDILNKAQYYQYEDLNKIYESGIDDIYKKDNILSLKQWVILLEYSVALISVYGLTEKEYIEWLMNCKRSDIPIDLFRILAGVTVDNEQQSKIDMFFENIFKREIMSINNLKPQNGIRISDIAIPNEKNQFKICNSYIIYSSDFVSYCQKETNYRKIFEDEKKEFELQYLKLKDKPNAFGKNFSDTLIDIVQYFQDSIENIKLTIIRNFRKNNVSAESVAEFINDYEKNTVDAKEGLLTIISYATQYYISQIPDEELKSYSLVDYAVETDNFRRIMNLPPASESISAGALHVANRAVTEGMKEIANTLTSMAINGIKMVSFENQFIKKMYDNEMMNFYHILFDSLRINTSNDFFECIDTPNFNMYDSNVEEKELIKLKNNYYGETNFEFSEEEKKIVVENWFLKYPRCSHVYTTAYLLFGDQIGEVDQWLDFLKENAYIDIDMEEISEEIKKIYIGNNKPEKLSEIEEQLAYIQNFTKSHKRIHCLDDIECNLMKMIKGYNFVDNIMPNLINIKKKVNMMIANAEDDLLWKEAELGNGYAAFMLLKIFKINNNGATLSTSNEYRRLCEKKSTYKAAQFMDIWITENINSEVECPEDTIQRLAEFLPYANFISAQEDFQRNEFDIAEKELEIAEKAFFPPAFKLHANYLLKGTNGYPQNINLSQEYKKIAELLGDM